MVVSNSPYFWALFACEIPSIVCSIFLLVILITDRTLRQSLNNHVVTILLVVNLCLQLIDNPSFLIYLRTGTVWPATPITCIIWNLVAYQFYITCTLFVVLASIERHILVFHQQWVATQRRRMLVHYLPIGMLSLYCLIYGIVLVIIFIKGGFPYDYTKITCGSLVPLIQQYYVLALWDMIVNDVLPAPLITIFSIALLVRVLYKRRKMNRKMEWKKQRKMITQLLSISALFCMMNLPQVLIYVALTAVPIQYLPGIYEAKSILGYLTYYQSIFLPFVCLAALWEGAKNAFNKIKQLVTHLKARNSTVVVPITTRQAF